MIFHVRHLSLHLLLQQIAVKSQVECMFEVEDTEPNVISTKN